MRINPTTHNAIKNMNEQFSNFEDVSKNAARVSDKQSASQIKYSTNRGKNSSDVAVNSGLNAEVKSYVSQLQQT